MLAMLVVKVVGWTWWTLSLFSLLGVKLEVATLHKN